MKWSKFNNEELEQRRLTSVEGLKNIRRDEFQERYQEKCDSLYWNHGKCCAGCDHWLHGVGRFGQCDAAGIMSGKDVLHSLDMRSCTYEPAPDKPYSQDKYCCGKFEDGFDWSSLPNEYLRSIGALRGGKLRHKPTERIKGT